MSKKFQKYPGCPLCTIPTKKVSDHYEVNCEVCGKFYFTDNAINDFLVIADSDGTNELDRRVKAKESRRDKAAGLIRNFKSSYDFPITKEMIQEYFN